MTYKIRLTRLHLTTTYLYSRVFWCL